MIRGLWLLTGVVVAVVAVFLAYPYLGALQTALSTLAGGDAGLQASPVASFILAAGLALLVVYAVTTLTGAVSAAVSVLSMQNNLRGLIWHQEQGESVQPQDLLAAVDAEIFADALQNHIAGMREIAMRSLRRASRIYAARPSADLLAAEVLVLRPVFADVMRPLPLLFLAVGLGGGALAYAGGDAMGLLAGALVGAAGLAVHWLTGVVVELRRAQLRDLALLVDRLYPPLGSSEPVAMLSQLFNEHAARMDEAREAALAALRKDMAAAAAGFAKRLEESESRRAKALARGLHEGLEPIGEELRAAAAKMAAGQEALLQEILDKFSADFDRQTAAALQEMTERLEAQVAENAARSEAVTAALREHLDEMASSVTSRGLKGLSEAAETVTRLAGVLEHLSTTIIPALNHLVSTQEDLRDVMARENETAARIAEAVAELRRLAEGLTRTPAAEQPAGSGNLRPLSPVADEVIEALEELRAENEQAAKTLPRI